MNEMPDLIWDQILQNISLEKNNWIIDIKQELYNNSSFLFKVAQKISQLIVKIGPDYIACKGLGGIPLAIALKEITNIPILCLREQRKGRDLNKAIEGPKIAIKSTIIVVDEVLNTGTTFRKICEIIKQEQPFTTILGIITVYDFWTGSGARQLEAEGYLVYRLFRRHDFGLTRGELTKGNVRKIWQNLAVSSVKHSFTRSTPLIVDDQLFIGTDNTSWLCLEKETGNILWEYDSPKKHIKSTASQPQRYQDSIITSSYDGIVRRLSFTGKPIWQTKVDNFIHSTPQICNGQIYLGTESFYKKPSGDVICLEGETGSEIWRFIPNYNYIPCTPLIIPDEDLLVIGSNAERLCCLDLLGNLLWERASDGEIKGQPAYANKKIFTVSEQGNIQVWDLTGNLLWQVRIGKGIRHAKPIVFQNSIIVSTNSELIVSFDQDSGKKNWINQQRGRINYSLAVYQEKAFAITQNGFLSLISLETGEKIWSEQLFDDVKIFQPPVFANPYLFVTTDTQGLVCFQVSNENFN